MQLTNKQKDFCRFYLESGDLKDAAGKSGYRISRARENLENPRVLYYLGKMGKTDKGGSGSMPEPDFQEKAQAGGLPAAPMAQKRKSGAGEAEPLPKAAEGRGPAAEGGKDDCIRQGAESEDRSEAFVGAGFAAGKAGAAVCSDPAGAEVNGDARDFFIGEIQKFWYRIIFEDETADLKDKIKASELIAKTTGAFGEPKNEEPQKTVRIVFGGEDEAQHYGE